MLWLTLISPELALVDAAATRIGADTYRVQLVVENRGWLPTYVMKKALEKQVVRGVICELALPDGATLATGLPRQELGQLEGRAYKPASPIRGNDSTAERLKAEWIVQAPAGASLNLTARHDRAGIVRATVELP